jgi:glucosamine 6-phosphate synthetase-like amidotransferase/phosphosugar isomerase protein
MCGIFGSITISKTNLNKLKTLVKHSEQRGKDSSGLIY